MFEIIITFGSKILKDEAMIKVLQKIKSNSKKSNGRFPNLTDYLCDDNCALYREEYFHDMLCLERKRTERSKKPFVLTLLNIEKVLHDCDKNKTIKEISRILFSATREIDIKGWFKYDHIMGIIFTEINGTDKSFLKQKIINNLRTILTDEQVNKVEIYFYIFPEDNNEQKPNSSVDLKFYPDIAKRKSSKTISLFIKRTIDIIGSIMGLLICFPLFILIPLCIKVTSKGPALFKQDRVGQFGEKITFLKFRTMYNDCDSSIHQKYIKTFISDQKSYITDGSNNIPISIYKINNDPRVTLIGRFLRKTSLDELPQFINVLKGEMSLVGPRPPIPYELENYDIWHMRRVLEIKPGISGPWQVWGRSTTTFDEMVRMEIQYLNRWSLWLDLKILLQTPWAVLNCKGSY